MSEMTDFSAVLGRLPDCLRKGLYSSRSTLKGKWWKRPAFGTVTPPIYTDPIKRSVFPQVLSEFYFCRKGFPWSRYPLHKELTAKSSLCIDMLTLISITHAFGNVSVKASFTARLGICTKTDGPSPVCLCPRRSYQVKLQRRFYIIRSRKAAQ